MHIHHLNCGCMCPLGGRLFDEFSKGLMPHLVCHCLLIETNQGLVLIDTGFCTQDVQAPYSRLSPFFVHLAGYTQGHAGIAIQTSEGWLLHAGDAYFYRQEMNPSRPDFTPGLRGYQTLMEVDRAKRLFNQDRLRNLSKNHGRDVRLFCSHDAIEFKTFANQSESRASQSIFGSVWASSTCATESAMSKPAHSESEHLLRLQFHLWDEPSLDNGGGTS